MDNDIFGRNATDKVGNQKKTLYYAISSNLCFYTTWQNGKRENHIFTQLDLLHTQCNCAVSSWKKKLSYVMCLIVKDIPLKIVH